MPTSFKIFIGAVVVVLVAGAIAGGYFYPKLTQSFGTSPQGATFSTEKTAAVAINLSAPGANATSTSILNTDSNDRYVSSAHIGCENVGTSKTAYTGTGLANLQLSVGTTTTAAPGVFSSAEAIMSNLNLATATQGMLVSSSSLLTATSTYATIWPSNTYMTFFFNATNTATCTVGVDYFGS